MVDSFTLLSPFKLHRGRSGNLFFPIAISDFRIAGKAVVRWAFAKVLQCRTPELGAEAYGLESDELIIDDNLQIACLLELWLPRHRTMAARTVGSAAR